MADELDSALESGLEANPEGGGESPRSTGSAVSEVQAEVPKAPKSRPSVDWISFLFILLAAVGVFSYGAGSPSPGLLGLGLWGWGLLDLISQKNSLKSWSGFNSGSNLLNLTRALFLLGMGSLLLLQSLGLLPVFGSNTLLIA